MDRDRICRILSKARTTVYDDIVPLLKADILKTQKHQIKPKGRKNVYYVLGDVIV